jgi:2-amino-4-hydroxy-6-hydroxymethyldihydropteridine diphosphokinase
MSEHVFLSLGSNLGDRLTLLRAAVRALRDMDDLRFVAASPVYETEPWDSEPGLLPQEQRWYLNCVVEVDTAVPVETLLERLKRLEADLGRSRPPGTPEAQRAAPRTLDIDILFYGQRVVSVPDDLHVPHLLLHERAFVLRPLADLAPEFEHPTLYQTVRELLEDVGDEHEVRRSPLPRAWFED